LEEKICHEEVTKMDEEEDHMLGGNLLLKANLKKSVNETCDSKYQENRNVIKNFFKTNVETMLNNKKIIIDIE
jgi:hypothetical protein